MSNYSNLLARLNKKTGPISLPDIVELLEEQTFPEDAFSTGSVERSIVAELQDRSIPVTRFGVVGDGVTDDTAAFLLARTAAELANQSLHIPGWATVLITDRITFRTLPALFGPGRILFNPSASNRTAIDIGDGLSTNNNNVSNIIIQGVKFSCTTDRSFISFIRIKNGGGDVANVLIDDCDFTFAYGVETSDDSWAISFGGEFGDVISRVSITRNRLYGPMQLVGNGGEPHYNDIVIDNNRIIGGKAAAIGFTRTRAATTDQSIRKRIRVNNNFIWTDRTYGIYLGMDGDDSLADMIWDDVQICDNSIYIDGAVGISPVGILFRAAHSTNGLNRRINISRNKVHVSSNVAIQVTYPTGTGNARPAEFDVTMQGNDTVGGEVYVEGPLICRIVGHVGSSGLFARRSANVEMTGCNWSRLRLESSTATVKSCNNTYNVRTGSIPAINVQSSSGATCRLFSMNDTFMADPLSGTASAVIAVGGSAGTTEVRIYNPAVRKTSDFTTMISLTNGKTIDEIVGWKKTGTVSIASGATSQTVTHGLGLTPSKIFIGIPNTTWGSATRAWVDAASITSTQFVLTVDAAPGQTVTWPYEAAA